MKLKKIASLMLAGIMAVSMLAACGEASNNGTDPETPVVPVTGAAAVVNDELDKNDEKITFTDNEVVTNLMTSYFAENPIVKSDWTDLANNVIVGNTTSFENLQDAINSVIGGEDAVTNYTFTANTDQDGTYYQMYCVGSKYITREDALRMVGQYLDKVDLPAETEDETHDLSYTGTIAAVEAKSEGETESIWVIVSTITQTSAKK